MSEVVDAQVVEEPGTELVPTTPSTLFRTEEPAEVLKRATDTANALKPVLDGQGMTQRIQGKDHVKVEGWTTLGAMLGVTPVCVWTRKTTDPKGWEARVEARTLDGRVIGAAEAQCLSTEKRWETAEDYAVRSMAQTRATSKALGSVLRFVVTLAGYSGTPAEEMDGVSQGDSERSAAPSDKQLDYLGNLLRKRDDVDSDSALLMVGWAKANLSGGREGSCSETIEILKTGGERADRAVRAMAERAAEWASKQTDVPADTEGLEPQTELGEDVPF